MWIDETDKNESFKMHKDTVRLNALLNLISKHDPYDSVCYVLPWDVSKPEDARKELDKIINEKT